MPPTTAKRSPNPGLNDGTLEKDLFSVLQASSKPLLAREVREKLAPEKRCSEERIRSALRALVASRALFEEKRGRMIRFAAEEPVQPERLARDAILAALADGPMVRQSLIDTAKSRASLGITIVERALAELRKAGRLFEHPPLEPRKKRYGLSAPDPGLYIATQLAELRQKQQSLEIYGVSREAFVRALVASLEQTFGIPMSTPRAAGTHGAGDGADAGADDESLLAAMRDLASQEGAEALLSIRRLREMRPFDKKRFDRAMLRLAATGRVVLHYHDFPQSLSSEERNLLVQDDRGVHYIGAALRRPS